MTNNSNNSNDIRASIRRHISKRVGDLYAPPKPGCDTPSLFQQNEPELCDKCGAEIVWKREEFTPARFWYYECECEPAEVGYDEALGNKCDREAREYEDWKLKR